MFLFIIFSMPLNAQVSSTNYAYSEGQADNGPGSNGSRKGPAPFEHAGSSHQDNHPAHAMPPAYTPIPYVPSKQINDLKAGIENLKELVQKRNRVQEEISSMYNNAQRAEIVSYATDSMQAAKEYYLADQIAEGNIAAAIADTLLDLATSLTPGVSWARDLYEAIAGKDLHSGEELDHFARSMAVLGAATFGFGSKAAKAVGVFEKLAKTADRFSDARRLLYEKPLHELKDTIGFFKRHEIYTKDDVYAVRVTNAFMKDASKEVLHDDLKVYRYYSANTNPRGSWVTTDALANPKRDLALEIAPTEMKEWLIPKGTEILKGRVAANYGEAGGGMQILVNKGLLREP